MPKFTHLHCHTQYSLLDGASKIPQMLDKAKEDGMHACAITDHGNMFGVFEFVSQCNQRDILPIIGCEFYLVEDRHKKEFKNGKKDKRNHQLLLAKNKTGYKNLSQMCSIGYLEGFYRFPRIDKELILKHHEGLIATSCCIAAEIPQAIIHEGEEKAEEKLKWWLDVFGEDFYIELQRHGIPNLDGTGVSQENINQTLLKFAKKYNVKVIATNDSHYVDQEDFDAHDILLCVQTNAKKATPVNKDGSAGKDGNNQKIGRFGFYNDEFFFKSQDQMNQLFADVPEAIDNTNEITSKVENIELAREVILPKFPIPDGFNNNGNEYLKHLTYEGAKKRYGDLNPTTIERIEHELNIISTMGFAGYFLIVSDFIKESKDRGVWVGPGRGSAAGSVVAYCIGITNVDPIHYNLLFERFLNPERVSMPDIDIDFDDEGRQKVFDYVVDKYGHEQVAQIVTFGSMAAKSAVRDVARVLDYPLNLTDKLAKLIPGAPGTTFAKAFEQVKELKDIYEGKGAKEEQEILQNAVKLEGTVRHTGIHAAGVIIAPDNVTNYIPVCKTRDAELYVTQFDGKYIEDAGMLKMDFLGLKTLSILKDAVENIKEKRGEVIDLDNIPLDDENTFKLFQKGDTTAIFQFESSGMRRYLKQLVPIELENLIAMNALYRPGPMDYIPDFIARRHGKAKIEYPHPLLEDLLKPTFGIMVYQEQIMECARIIGGYTLGGADLLRRAMGKKKVKVMEEQREIFIQGASEKNINNEKAGEIFDIMAKFAGYGFNRSHSAAYALLAYSTAYLKANYPEEFLASVMTHSMNNLEKLTFFLDECKRMGITTMGPDVNESGKNFTVTENGKIRFGLTAVKGVGGAAVESLISERKENGPYKSIFDLTRRVNLRAVNKKSLESLAQAGAFDNFGNMHRAQYFKVADGNNDNLLTNAIKHGSSYQTMKEQNQNSLFGTGDIEVADPDVPPCQEWNLIEKLQYEKEVTGMYLSGHPLDPFQMLIKNICNAEIDDVEHTGGKELRLAGIVTASGSQIGQKGNRFGRYTIEDYSGSMNLMLFDKRFLEFGKYMEHVGSLVFVRGKRVEKKKTPGEFYFAVSEVDMLTEVTENFKKNLIVHLEHKDVNEGLINELATLIKENPGKQMIIFRIFDQDQTDPMLDVKMYCKQYKIDVTNEVLKKLTSVIGQRYEFIN